MAFLSRLNNYNKMKLTPFHLLLLLSAGFTAVNGQPLRQIGFYEVAGNLSMDSKINTIILGGGDIVDISTPHSPKRAGKASLRNHASAVLVSGNYAFFGNDIEAGLEIVDVSNPANPELISSLSFPEAVFVFSIARADSALYLLMSSQRIYRVDIKDMQHPVVTDTLLTGWVFDVVIRDRYAYVSGYDNGLQVIDISDAKGMKTVSSAGKDYYSVELADTLAFLGSDSHGGIDVYSIANPLHPFLLYAIPGSNEGPNWDLKYRNRHLYAATRDKGMFIYEIGERSGIMKAGYNEAGMGECYALSLQDSLILLSTAKKGIAILQFDLISSAVHEVSAAISPAVVYPNPAKDFIRIKNPPILTSRLEIIDMKGNIVRQAGPLRAGEPLNIAYLPPGCYLLRMISEKEVTVAMVIRAD
jgi:hypothetical protein